ncbi:ribonuclease HII [Caldibacillus lycopersici]|uniref:Ribonuclease HII n=1 Tax=Perspicuibacillus lycopersici TaxID=1325689 RepID=A0AAE3IPS0_9BACI|nr:ribonuclease HII [Perspicuibacillus lycopersici]MCU9612121.1 ribonuclease HII [Perspicuibacillus lycopersici]
MNYTIKEVENRLEQITNMDDPFLLACMDDERKGVQSLISRWKKRQAQQNLEHIRLEKMKQYEKEARQQGFQLIAGIDEVGRGPLAGPVVAAAVILPEDIDLPGVNDSKKLSASKRELLYEQILEKAIAVGIGVVDSNDIDHLNIYQATKKAMHHAVNDLSVFPEYLLLDAMKIDAPLPQLSLIKGDALSISIASASIVAKVYRDRIMAEYGIQYPAYHLEKNMGYGTKEHLQALEQYGPTPIHRKSFSPIKEMVEMKIK